MTLAEKMVKECKNNYLSISFNCSGCKYYTLCYLSIYDEAPRYWTEFDINTKNLMFNEIYKHMKDGEEE